MAGKSTPKFFPIRSSDWLSDQKNIPTGFISEDPIKLAGGLNPYAYVYGNPLAYTDPSGLEGVGAWTFPPGPARDAFEAAQRRFTICRLYDISPTKIIGGAGLSGGAAVRAIATVYGVSVGSGEIADLGIIYGPMAVGDGAAMGFAGAAVGLPIGAAVGGLFYLTYISFPACNKCEGK